MAEAWTERFGAIIVFWYQYDRFFEKGIEQICNKSRLFSGKLGSFWAEYLLWIAESEKKLVNCTVSEERHERNSIEFVKKP
jgi:hypothetical protein